MTGEHPEQKADSVENSQKHRLWKQERVNQKPTSIQSGFDRRSFMQMLGAGAFITGPGTGVAAAQDDLSEMSDDELMSQISELFDEIETLISGSHTLLLSEYRFEALQSLKDDISERDLNKSNKRTLLRSIRSAIKDNNRGVQAVLDRDLESASRYQDSVERTTSIFCRSINRINEDQVTNEIIESWRERAATIINAREEPLSVFELIEEGQASEEWWEEINERIDNITVLLQELQDRGYSITVEEEDGELGLSVNPFFAVPVAPVAIMKGAALFGVTSVTLLQLSAALSQSLLTLQQLLLQLPQHHPVIQRLLLRPSVPDELLLDFFEDLIELIDVIEQYDPDVHDPIQLVGAILVIGLPFNPPVDLPDTSLIVRLIDAETGEPIPDGTVTLMYLEQADDPFGPRATDENGVVTYEDIDVEGEYAIRGRAAGYAEQEQEFTLEADDPIEITLELEPEEEVETSILTVTVVDADTGDPVQTLPNVYVDYDGERVETVRANDQGRAQISVEDGREYTVSAMDEIPRSSEERTVTVDGDTEITLALNDEDGPEESEPHVLTVNALTDEGDPLHAYVQIEGVDTSEAVIDPDTEFAPTWRFELENGTYTVEVIDPGDAYLPTERTVEIDGGDEEITVELEPNEDFPP